MEVVLLGTGAADGWPNPFCRCASCAWARASGDVRGQSAALVDDRLLLDCGPEAPRAAARLGRDLAGVRVLLLTHAHPDHLGPAALLWRQWAGMTEPIDIAGPPDAVEQCRAWLPPETAPAGGAPPARLHAVAPGETLTLHGYRCTAVEGAHEASTLLWDVEDPDGSSLLYATDTGPLPGEAVAGVAGREYDLVLLEETFGDHPEHGTGHLDLTTFPRELAALRRAGAVDSRTRVVATHLGHHNPPGDELARRLGAWGAEPGRDGDVLVLGAGRSQPVAAARSAAPATVGRGTSPDREAPLRTLVLGGARSGKSREAERLLAAEPAVVYVATAGERDDDPEWRARVRAHRERRPRSWRTVETTDLEPLLATEGPPLLVDCLALWLTAVLDDTGAWEQDRWDDVRQRVAARTASLVDAWRRAARVVVAVSNEVGSGVVPGSWSGRLFRDELGSLNARLAGEADRVLLVVAGQVSTLRG